NSRRRRRHDGATAQQLYSATTLALDGATARQLYRTTLALDGALDHRAEQRADRPEPAPDGTSPQPPLRQVEAPPASAARGARERFTKRQHVTITDNTILVLKERVVDEFYDPLIRVLRLLGLRRKK